MRHHSQNVVTQPVRSVVSVIRRGHTRRTEAAPGDSVHMMTRFQLGREGVVDMGVVTDAGKQDDGRANAAPIQNLELDALRDRDEENLVRRRVACFGWERRDFLRRMRRILRRKKGARESQERKRALCRPLHTRSPAHAFTLHKTRQVDE